MSDSEVFYDSIMAIYAIGDVQGCASSLEALVQRIRIRPRADRLWFVGDLVNRGPRSADVLMLIRAAGSHAVSVLGNHDIHLLAVACGARKASASDTVWDVLNHREAKSLIEWLRHQPLAHAEGNTLMVHAGVMPGWTATQTLSLAQEVERRLRSIHWQDFLNEMFGNSPGHWRDSLRGSQRLRAILNVLCRIRFLRPDQKSLDFKCKLSPGEAPEDLTAWFDVPGRKTSRQTVVFGHWSTLGLIVRPNLIGLDSGCVWGGYLSAVRLEDRAIFQQVAVD